MREVDASIRQVVDGVAHLTTVECRKRRGRQDVTWIEQLATKKHSIGADKTIAVSASGFSDAAHKVAEVHGIELKATRELSIADLNPLAKLDLVLFWHKRARLQSVGFRFFRSLEWTLPDSAAVDYVLPADTDPFQPIFRNIEQGHSWSINDLWYQLQEMAEPFAGIAKGDPPATRTVCFPYPGNVRAITPIGPKRLGDVLLIVALWLDREEVTLEMARKVEYQAPGQDLQRLEFASQQSADEEWRMAIQLAKGATCVGELRTNGNWPSSKKSPFTDD